MEKTSNKYKTLVRFEDGIEIRADILNWVLYIPRPRAYWYYSSLDCLFSDLLNLKIKKLASKNSKKTIEALGKAIIHANKEIEQIISAFTTVKVSAQSRLDLQGVPKKEKDDQSYD